MNPGKEEKTSMESHLPSVIQEQSKESGGQKLADRRSNRRKLLRGGLAAVASVIGTGAVLEMSTGTAFGHAHTPTAPDDNPGNFSSSVSGVPAVTAVGTNGAHGIDVGNDNTYGIYTTSTDGIALSARSNSNNAISATSNGNDAIVATSTTGNGVSGSSSSYTGVYGSSTQGYGVLGQSVDNLGVMGTSQINTGVYGSSAGYYGIYGIAHSSYAAVGCKSIGPKGKSGSAISRRVLSKHLLPQGMSASQRVPAH